MTSNSQPDDRVPSQTDDAFWASLFQTEEGSLSLAPAPVQPPVTRPVIPAQADLHASWVQARAAEAADELLELTVTGQNKGGLLVVWRDLQGFVPASQLLQSERLHIPAARIKALRKLVGKTLRLKIIEVDEVNNRFVLSERAAQVGANARDELRHTIRSGMVRQGVVTNLTSFGAFVDLGGLEGLIHLSELSWRRVRHPSEIVEPNQTVSVLVLSVDLKRERIALSLKQLQQDPWQTVADRYQPEQLVTGTVTNVTNYGAFVRLEKGLEGLVHISELAEGTFLHPRNVVSAGETVSARVLTVDAAARRLALSMRNLKPPAASL